MPANKKCVRTGGHIETVPKVICANANPAGKPPVWLPLRGKLSPQVTDEGKICGYRTFVPHPARRRATFPRRGKAFLLAQITLCSIHLPLRNRAQKQTPRQIQSINIPNHTPVRPIWNFSTKM